MYSTIVHFVLAMFLLATTHAGFAAEKFNEQESQAIELAKKTLAKQEKIDINNIQMDSMKAVQWPDSSLGCPEPGMMYSQMITSGYQITLSDSVSNTRHTVHTGKGFAVICKTSQNTQLKTEKNLRFGQRWQLSQKAQKSLAAKLSIPKNAVRIVGTSTVPAKSVNCKINPETNLKEIQIIKLSFNNTQYQYVVINNQLVLCQ